MPLQAVNRRELRLGQKSCLNVPLFHAFGLIYGQISSILSGCTTILESRSFDPIKSLKVMAEEKCDVTYGTPTMWVRQRFSNRFTILFPLPPLFTSFNSTVDCVFII